MITEHQRIFEPVSEIKYKELEQRRIEIENRKNISKSNSKSSSEESKEDFKPIEIETYNAD